MKCKNCKYGCEENYEDDKGYRCTIDMSWVPKDVADDDDYPCELYVADVDDDN